MPVHDMQRGARVAVVGAGVSGLTAARWLLAEGLTPVVLEQAATIGGLWNYREDAPDGGGLAYRSLRTNTSRQTMAFSDYPFPATLPDFPTRADVLAYLHGYAEAFGLGEHIRLRTTVDAVRPAPGGGWEVALITPAGRASERVAAVVLCSGRDRLAAAPTYPGEDSFTGRMVHSRYYKGPEAFAGQDVVVVGLGSSGAELAVELCGMARSVVLSTSRGGWIIPRYMGGRPYDHLLTRAGAAVPYGLRMAVFRRLILREYQRMGLGPPPAGTGIPAPPFDVWSARLTANSELLPLAARGVITAKPAIQQLDGAEAVFADGTRAKAGVILNCTGYAMAFPFLADLGLAAPGASLDLYKHVFHPDRPGLAFIGLPIVAGPLPPVAELQARWVARVLSGAAPLPSRAAMRAEIARRRAWLAPRTPYPMRVQLPDYLEELAGLISARPRLLRHPRLLGRLLFGPVTAAHYRLDGPNRLGSGAPVRSDVL